MDISGKLGELVAEIAAASNEQAVGIEQVTKAVAEMDSVVQQVPPMPRNRLHPPRR